MDGTRTLPQLPKWLVKRCLGGVVGLVVEVSTNQYSPPRPVTTRGRRLNPAQVDLLVEGYLKGKTVYQLGAEFGIRRQTVSTHLKRKGVAMRMQGLAESERAAVVRLREQGWSFARLGEHFRVDGTTVMNFLRKTSPGAAGTSFASCGPQSDSFSGTTGVADEI